MVGPWPNVRVLHSPITGKLQQVQNLPSLGRPTIAAHWLWHLIQIPGSDTVLDEQEPLNRTSKYKVPPGVALEYPKPNHPQMTIIELALVMAFLYLFGKFVSGVWAVFFLVVFLTSLFWPASELCRCSILDSSAFINYVCFHCLYFVNLPTSFSNNQVQELDGWEIALFPGQSTVLPVMSCWPQGYFDQSLPHPYSNHAMNSWITWNP